MTLGEKYTVISPVISFNDVVDEACEKLMERQIKYSIRRIQEMEERLSGMERELDDFLSHRGKVLG